MDTGKTIVNKELSIEFARELSRIINISGINCRHYAQHFWASVYIEDMIEYDFDLTSTFMIACGADTVFETSDVANPNFTPVNIARIILEDFKVRKKNFPRGRP